MQSVNARGEITADMGASRSCQSGHGRRDVLAGCGLGMVTVAALCATVLLESRPLIGAASLAMMLGLIFLNVPVGIAMIGAAVVGLASVANWDVVVSTMGSLPFAAVTSWSLSVLPMFVFMGIMLWRAAVTERLFTATRRWLYWLPGGLAMTTNWAGAGLGAVSGSTIGIAHALTRIALPEMLRSGYDPRMATGAILMAGTGGQLLPPSIFMVIYAGIASQPVGMQLLAGVVPGVLLALLYGASILAIGLARPAMCPRRALTDAERVAKWRVTARAWPIPLLIVVVVGGLASGVFTSTEAGAFGAIGAIGASAASLRPRAFGQALSRSLIDTAITTASIMVLVIGASLITRLMALTGVTRELEALLGGLQVSSVGLIVMMCVIYLALGAVFDPLTIMLLTVPVVLPVLEGFGISPLWFGVFVVLMCEVSVTTPPVGMLSFVVARVAREPDIRATREVTLSHVFGGAVWFLPLGFVLVALMVVFPQIVTWLPGLAG